MYIPGKMGGIFVRFNKNCLDSFLKQMPGSIAFGVEICRVGPVNMPHDLGQVPFRGLKQQVIMIAHQAIDMNLCPITLGCRFQIGKKFFSVPFAFKHILPLIPPGGDMVKSSWILYAQWPCHFFLYLASRLLWSAVSYGGYPLANLVKCVDLTLRFVGKPCSVCARKE